MSVSYLNEIEKGKKYPKKDKQIRLAKELKIPLAQLISAEATDFLAPVSELLHSNFLNELPFELFDIDITKVIEIIANAPKKVGAFISTLVELSRNYALAEENFYFGALRSYLEMHNHYFEEIEVAVEKFSGERNFAIQKKLNLLNGLSYYLRKIYGYTIIKDGLDAHPDLQIYRSVFIPKKKQLLLNSNLSKEQLVFQLAKELGFNYLGLKERAFTSSLTNVSGFDAALNHFKAGYFAAALLIPRGSFVEDLRIFFAKKTWEPDFLTVLLTKYQASAQILFQRMANILPKYFGINDLFLLRIKNRESNESFKIDRELHLHRRHHPHSNKINEHYCRRWISIRQLQLLKVPGKQTSLIINAQRSSFHDSDAEYFVMSAARKAYNSSEKNVSITIGLFINDNLKEKINFIDDPGINKKIVNKTCERCAIKNCKERSAAPKWILKKEKQQKVAASLRKLLDE